MISLLIAAIAAISCSGNGDPSSPTVENTPLELKGSSALGPTHYLWGLWEFTVDPENGTLEYAPLRTGNVHINLLPILQPPVASKLLVSNVVIDQGVLDVDVSIVHPFPGYSIFSGFDIAAIIITNGSVTGFSDPALVMAGDGDTRLLNADGYTRWWNPAEFANTGTVLGYTDGILGKKDEIANYNCTLNGFKLYGNDLNTSNDPIDVGPTNRLFFKNGFTNTRHLKISLAAGFQFNYAIDACWEAPSGEEPYNEDDFPPEANRAEAWLISVAEVENTLWNENASGGGCGGYLSLLIDVWDHQNAGQNLVWMESPGVFPQTDANLISEGDGYATYGVAIENATPTPDSIEILFGIESEVVGYWNHLPDEPLSS
jgi:hypothetical protein